MKLLSLALCAFLGLATAQENYNYGADYTYGYDDFYEGEDDGCGCSLDGHMAGRALVRREGDFDLEPGILTQRSLHPL